MKEIRLENLAATEALARQLAAKAKPGDCIALQGDLGAGKTAFARAFIHALAPDAGEVTSPTFALMQRYECTIAPIWHVDLYRLRAPGELQEIGLEEALHGAISLIEWPDIARALLPEETLWVSFSPGETPEARGVTMKMPPGWRKRLGEYAA
jgi:tRNA threonylcarbamoyl adenosine modification protein YjeE